MARHEEINGEISGLEDELERLRGLQQSREKDRVALDHDMRKMADDLSRVNTRLSVARLELERLRRDAGKSAEQRERNLAAVAEKERLRAEREQAMEAERRELETIEGQAATIGEEHAALRAQLAAVEERQRGERSAMNRLEQQFREVTNRRNSIAGEMERLGEQRARLLASNIELDRNAGLLAEVIASLEAQVCEMAMQDTGMREGLRASDEELKELRAGVEQKHELRSQIEIDLVRKQSELRFLEETSRKELGCAVEELSTADDPIPEAEAIAEAEQGANEVRNRIEASRPG